MMSNAKPYDAEVEYLESSGTQWVDTGYYPQMGDYIEVVLCNTTANNAHGENKGFGATNKPTATSGREIGGGLRWSANRMSFYFNNTNAVAATSFSSVVQPFKWFSERLTLRTTNFYVEWEDMDTHLVYESSHHTIGSSSMPDSTMYLFAGSSNTWRSPSWKRIKEAIVIRDNAEILHMIPVRVGQVGYMYDLVSGQLCGNVGTGSFVLGNDIN